jgi:predicted RNA-binding Zn ribbon-like protein
MMAVNKFDAGASMVEHQFDFIGANLCLDFANTLGGLPADSETQERLTTYTRLVGWSQQAKLMTEYEAQHLLRQAENDPAEAVAIVERAIIVREAIRSIFLAVARNAQPSESDLVVLNSELEQAMAGARVTVTPNGFDLEWLNTEGALDQMLGPVVRSAATLLTSGERHLVRKCAHDRCQWVFVDTTKNHSRQWCRASGCGNMMRVRKHRKRQRENE